MDRRLGVSSFIRSQKLRSQLTRASLLSFTDCMNSELFRLFMLVAVFSFLAGHASLPPKLLKTPSPLHNYYAVELLFSNAANVAVKSLVDS